MAAFQCPLHLIQSLGADMDFHLKIIKCFLFFFAKQQKPKTITRQVQSKWCMAVEVLDAYSICSDTLRFLTIVKEKTWMPVNLFIIDLLQAERKKKLNIHLVGSSLAHKTQWLHACFIDQTSQVPDPRWNSLSVCLIYWGKHQAAHQHH